MNEILKIGTKVRMVNCAEADRYRNKIWTTRSLPWKCSNEEVVLLEGFSGGFNTSCLEVVEK